MSNIISALLNFVAGVCLLPTYPFYLFYENNTNLTLISLVLLFMCIQLLFAYIFKSKFVRLIPVFYCAASAVCLLFEFILQDFFRGWDALIMVFQVIILICCAVGLALAWLIYSVDNRYIKMRSRKLLAKEDSLGKSMNEPISEEINGNEAVNAVSSEDIPAAEEVPSLVKKLFFRKYAEKKDSSLIFRMTKVENTWERDTGVISDIFLFLLVGLYCITLPLLPLEASQYYERNVFYQIISQLLLHLVAQLIFCYAFRKKIVKAIPAYHAVILFVIYIASVAYLGGNTNQERFYLFCMKFSSVGAILGTVLGWIIYYAHDLKRKADSVVILAEKTE